MSSNKAIGRFGRAVAFAAAAALAAGSIAPAIAKAQDNAQAPAPKQEKKAQKYCAAVEGTGTRLRTRECKTREAWIKENGFDPVRP